MSHMIAVAFDEIDAADAVLGRLRSLEAEHLLELEDALVAQRDRGGRLHLKQALGHHPAKAIPGEFWHGIAAQIFGRNHVSVRPAGSEETLPADFVQQVSRALEAETSALLILVGEVALEPLLESLRGHPGTVLRCELAECHRSQLSAALSAPPKPPSAAELAALAADEAEHEAASRAQNRASLDSARQRRVHHFREDPLTTRDQQEIMHTCIAAARQGHDHALVMRFPCEVCADGGRAINNGEAGWPATLIGQPRSLYDYWERELRPAGYHVHARIIDFAGGVPAEVGLTLNWASGADPRLG